MKFPKASGILNPIFFSSPSGGGQGQQSGGQLAALSVLLTWILCEMLTFLHGHF